MVRGPLQAHLRQGAAWWRARSPWVLGLYFVGLVGMMYLGGSAVRSIYKGSSLPDADDGAFRTRYRCLPLEKGADGRTHANLTTCEFTNLVLWQGQLHVVDPTLSSADQLPNINVDWFVPGSALPLALVRDLGELLNASGLEGGRNGTQQQQPPMEHLPRVVLAGFSFYHNFYHAFAEYAPAVHSLVCKVWGDCGFDAGSDLTVVMANRPHVFEHHHHDPMSAPAMQCVTAKRVVHLWHPDFEGKLVVLDKAVAGFGVECRADEFHCMPWEEHKPPDHALMVKWRARVARCIGFDDKKVAPVDPIRIVIIDRPYELGRHFMNADLVVAHIRERYGHVAEVSIEYLENRSMQEQAAVYNNATIVIWNHGAAMGNLIYTPVNALGLQVVFMPEPQALFAWPEQLVRDLPHNVTLKHIVNRDPDRLLLRAGWVRLGDSYQRMTKKEKLAIWEQKQCPTAYGEEITIECGEFWVKIAHVFELDLDLLDSHLQPAVDYFVSLRGKQGRRGRRNMLGQQRQQPAEAAADGEEQPEWQQPAVETDAAAAAAAVQPSGSSSSSGGMEVQLLWAGRV